jgi:hypothetical protein
MALSTKRLNYKQFLRRIGKYWITDQTSGIGTNLDELGPSKSQLPRRVLINDYLGRSSMDMKKHRAIKIVTGGKKKYPQRQCRVRSVHKNKVLTNYMYILQRSPSQG